jgi:hypothetical protein
MSTLTDAEILARTHTGPVPTRAWHQDGQIHFTMSDGREHSFPASKNPRLAVAKPEQLDRIEVSPFGLHWPDLDEDLGVEAILDGRYGRPWGGRRAGAGRKPTGRLPKTVRMIPEALRILSSLAERGDQTEGEVIETLLIRTGASRPQSSVRVHKSGGTKTWSVRNSNWGTMRTVQKKGKARVT